jgi:hypothetical protein
MARAYIHMATASEIMLFILHSTYLDIHVVWLRRLVAQI